MASSAYTSDFKQAEKAYDPINEDMFGANIVADRNTLVPGGPFDTVIDMMGVTSLRYPGGTVVNLFCPNEEIWDDIFGPTNAQYAQLDNGDYVMGPAPVFEYAVENNLGVTFVLPVVDHLLVNTGSGKQTVDQFHLDEFQKLLNSILHGKYGEAPLDRIEIGNEYYVSGDLTAKEYGMIANEMIIMVGNTIEAPPGWEPPQIAIQVGAGWNEGETEAIIDQLSPKARGYIDEVLIHYYSEDLSAVDNRDHLFDEEQVWQAEDGLEHVHMVVTEWNVYGSESADKGLAQASTLISAFEEMVRQGVDEALFWGVQFRYTQSAASTVSDYDTPDAEPGSINTRLTAAGEIFASLAESVQGLVPFDPTLSVLLDNNGVVESIGPTNPNADLIVNAFGSEDEAVIYYSSRSEENIKVSQNLNTYFGNVTHVWAEVLTTVDNPATKEVDEGDPLTANGIPEYQILNANDLMNGAVVQLGAYEIMRVHVQLDGHGVTMRGHDGDDADPIDLDDTMIGSSSHDSIHGYAGDDLLQGEAGNDVMHGHEGFDTLEGSAGADTLRGGADQDTLYGDSGSDVLTGGGDSDTLYGQGDNDLLQGGSAADLMYGGDGRDILRGGPGMDDVYGGDAGDYYIIDKDSQTVIHDWDPSEGDKITFLGQFKSYNDLLANATTTAGSAGQPGDLIISGPEGSTTTLVGAANKLGSLENSVTDFTPEGEAALDLADDLNARTGAQIDNYIGSMNPGEFDRYVLSADPIILFASLEPRPAAQMLNAMDEDQTKEFLAGKGGDGLSLFLEDLSGNEMKTFVTNISPDSLEATVDHVGYDAITARAEDVSSETASTLDRKMQQTSYRREEDDPPKDPPDDKPDKPDPDPDNGSGSSGGDCFIAGAVYLDGDHPDIWLLRWYRDNILRRHAAGRVFIRVYGVLGPRAARFVRPRPRLRAMAMPLIKRAVAAVSARYDRKPGRQPDHRRPPYLPDKHGPFLDVPCCHASGRRIGPSGTGMPAATAPQTDWSKLTIAPVIRPASSDTRKFTARAASAGSTSRPNGNAAAAFASQSGSPPAAWISRS
jgi:hypothetical protein